MLDSIFILITNIIIPKTNNKNGNKNKPLLFRKEKLNPQKAKTVIVYSKILIILKYSILFRLIMVWEFMYFFFRLFIKLNVIIPNKNIIEQIILFPIINNTTLLGHLYMVVG